MTDTELVRALEAHEAHEAGSTELLLFPDQG
jgi:hypothetical protein